VAVDALSGCGHLATARRASIGNIRPINPKNPVSHAVVMMGWR
jgi:hypothetical protein